MSYEHADAGGVPKDPSEELKDLAFGDISISVPDKIPLKPDDVLAKDKKCGDCYIFDYQNFGETSRPGSEFDVARLEHDFTALNFKVYRDFLDLTEAETLNALDTAAKKDHTQSKYFVCCFLTHGIEGKLLMSDKYIKIDDILQCFSRSACESLSGKPKIFIFQACRGSCCEDGVPIDSTDIDPVKVPNESTDFGSVKNNPDYLDFLIVYSTYKGKYSFKTKSKDKKENNHGSYFIDELCRTIEQFSDELDLLQILTITNYRVAYFFETKYTEVEEHRNKKTDALFYFKIEN